MREVGVIGADRGARMTRNPAAWALAGFGIALAQASSVAAAPVQRTLDISVTVDATQDWRNEPKWGKASTQQRYTLSTQLRSDGKLYADNLLDPDPTRRVQIKQDWYLYQGLLEIKAEHGGKLPAAGAATQPMLSAESLATTGGMASPLLANVSPRKLSALQALQDNSPEDMEAFIRSYDQQKNARWMVFEGFAGCKNALHIIYHSKFEGDISRKTGRDAPFDMQWTADTRGTPEQQQGLCRRYVATYDPAANTLFVENLYLPSPVGTSVRNEFGRTERKERELPPVSEVMRWADAALKQARGTGTLSATLPITAALDGNDAMLGSFQGTAKTTLVWSFR